MDLREFYRGRRVLITGHTGFKGSWLCRILELFGAEVTGYSLEPPTDPALFFAAGIGEEMESITGDVRDLPHLLEVFQQVRPEIVLHLAAQPLVRESYKDPVGTYSTNVMGTVNLLEAVRQTPGILSVLNVTTDKVYLNREWPWGYREDDPLDGYDPYSNSKSCSELVTHSYIKSFFSPNGPAVSTARAGNVIGGGDFAADRIVPDCVRAALAGEKVLLRNPNSTRPFQHVLEPLFAYLMIAKAQAEAPERAGFYNVGPDERDCVTTGELAELFCSAWGQGLSWEASQADGPHEANFLKLDCSLLKSTFGWKPVWGIREAIGNTVSWSRVYGEGGNVREVMDRQIRDYEEDFAPARG